MKSENCFLKTVNKFLNCIAPLAQLVEQLTLNQWVASSSLAGCTTLLAHLKILSKIN